MPSESVYLLPLLMSIEIQIITEHLLLKEKENVTDSFWYFNQRL